MILKEVGSTLLATIINVLVGFIFIGGMFHIFGKNRLKFSDCDMLGKVFMVIFYFLFLFSVIYILCILYTDFLAVVDTLKNIDNE